MKGSRFVSLHVTNHHWYEMMDGPTVDPMKHPNDRSSASRRAGRPVRAVRRGARVACLLASVGLAGPASAGAPSHDNDNPYRDPSRSKNMTNDHRQQNSQAVRNLFEAFNHDDLRALDDVVASEYVGPQSELRGPAAFRAIASGLRSAFPDLHYTLDDVLAEGEEVAVRWHWTGTHNGPFRGYPATGRAVTNNGIGIFRIREGKIASASLETDRLGFLQQIGIVAEGVGTGARPSTPIAPSQGPSPK